jgi:hypothetical protein
MERFWGKVDFDGLVHPVLGTPCWVWTGKPSHGYGRFGQVSAHRVAFALERGPIPDGRMLDHLCHTLDASCRGGDDCQHRLCVNPAHLEIVTNDENLRRGRRANQAKTHCPKGHPYDMVIETKRGISRGCRACRRERSLARSHGGPGQGGRERARTHCPAGHPYDDANTYIDPTGRRKCRTCHRDRQRAQGGG